VYTQGWSGLRLDKFLKQSRIIKRRILAKEAIEKGFISRNGIQAKPSSEVKPGDTISIRYSNRTLVVKVLEDFEIEILKEIKE
jgi:ribosomal 50S subunit-recycling heat shock protein